MTAAGDAGPPASRPAPGYPRAGRRALTDDLFGHQVADPYRWLEDPASQQARDWLAAQDELWLSQAAALPAREPLASRVEQLMAAGFVGTPVWRGERQFFIRRLPDEEHGVLLTAAPGEPERVLVDPMAIDPSGLTTLDSWQPDQEGRLLAYQLSAAGDEESVLRVLDVATGAGVDGPVSRCRYSPVAWLPGGATFYYVRRLPPDQVPAGEEQFHRRVYLHTVGAPDSGDVLIFGHGLDKTNYYGVSVSRDGRWLVIAAAQGTAPRNDLWLADLTVAGPARPALRVVQQGVDARTGVHVGRDGRLYVFTDAGAPRGRLAVTDPARPEAENWRDLIAEDPAVILAGYAILDGPELARPVLLASWTRHAVSEITVHDLATGERTGTLELPGAGLGRLGSTGGISERPEGGHEAWFDYTDNTTPLMIYHYDARGGAVRVWATAPGAVQVPDVATRQLSYTSKDGTEVRMIIISQAEGGTAAAAGPPLGAERRSGGPGGRPPGSARPAILSGYGGFGISMSPAYSASALAWVEAGGVYAIAGLRGGGEEGEDWHRAGMREHKQHVFDDFHAAAAALIAAGWTTPGQLGISGGSNGGLLVGAAITQRPELYAAAACSAPLLDMIRYERFGLGQTWNDEYGTAARPDELGWLLGYSPYHHVQPGTRYPATLFTVFDNDTRVDPVHARKMCAALQYATSARWPDRPVLLRREAQVGHGARAVSRSVALSADTLAFLAFHTGLSW
ncbi:MAG TPA: prolyl oligopeptidase family serine peptidase [Streptosporangiaceae bacterium]|nr:prolyl oligopeptidase family serine peptidase [Streptosporangiaceae bacterium]